MAEAIQSRPAKAIGDATAIMPYICMLIVGVCGLFITLIAGRKKKRNKS